MSSNSSDSGLIRLKESLPSDVAGKMITKNKNTETLKFRMEIINPNGSKTIDSHTKKSTTIFYISTFSLTHTYIYVTCIHTITNK